MTLMIATTLVGAITVGTFAAFSDEESDLDNDITAGVVDIELVGGGHCVAGLLIPDDDIDWGDGPAEECVTGVTNTSDIAIDVYLKFALTPVACAGPAEFCDEIADITGTEVLLDVASFASDDDGLVDLLGEGEAYEGAGDLGDLAACTKIGNLAAGEGADVSFDGTLDDVGNAAQGDSLKIDLLFEVVQEGAEAPDCAA
jgi:predicted ribosomally synthesized peptide with SipW-like signal peptide